MAPDNTPKSTPDLETPATIDPLETLDTDQTISSEPVVTDPVVVEPTPSSFGSPIPSVDGDNAMPISDASGEDAGDSKAPAMVSEAEDVVPVAADDNVTDVATPDTASPSQDEPLPASSVVSDAPTVPVNTPESTSGAPNEAPAVVAGSVFGSAVAPSAGNVTEPSVGKPGKTGSKKKLFAIIGSLVAAFVVVGGVSAYMIIRNSPEMILQDAFYNTSKQTRGHYAAKFTSTGEMSGEMSAVGDWEKGAFSSDVETTFMEKDFSMNFVLKDEKFYVKVNEVSEIVSDMLGSDPTTLAMYKGLIDKVDGKWVVITEKDLEEYFGLKKDEKDKDSQQCVQDAIDNFQADKKQQKEVLAIYNENKFVIFTKKDDEKIEQKEAYHFTVTTDAKKAEDFAKKVESTAVYEAINACVKDATGADYDKDSSQSKHDTNYENPDADIDVWIDKSSRTLRKVSVKKNATKESPESVTMQAIFDFDTAKPITVPKADTTVKDLMNEVGKLGSPMSPVLGARSFRP